MLSSSGISWRQGPHQLAQKLIMTTSPLNWARLTCWPLVDCRVKAGAAAGATESAAASAAAQAGSASVTSAARSAAAVIRFCICILPCSEEDRSAEDRLEVVGELLGAQQISLEKMVLDAQTHRQPIERQDLVAPAEGHRELLVAGELGPAHAGHDVETARHGVPGADEGFARQEVVTQSEIVVRELPLTLGQQLNVTAQGLEAGASAGGPAELGPQEEVLRD